MKLVRKTLFIILQIVVIICLTFLIRVGLESIPVPDVLKNLSIVELDDLDRGLLQTAVDFKTRLSSDDLIDQNIVIIDVETINPINRGEVGKTIKILKDNGAKTIALSFFLDQSYDKIDPTWDTILANAIIYKENNVIATYGIHYFENSYDLLDTMVALQPIDIFQGFYDAGYSNLERTEAKEGGVVQQFYPNIEYGDKLHKSFALAVALHFDSTRASKYLKETDIKYITFYRNENFNIWKMSYVHNPIIANEWLPLIKDKVFIFGYINPDPSVEALRTFMENTNSGKLDYCIVQAGIVSDILNDKFIPESPFWIDMMLGVFYGLFNILFYLYASRKTLMWEKFTGGRLIIIEIVFHYGLVLAIFLFFNYKLSVIIPSLVIMISIPFNHIVHNKVIPFYNRITARIKYSDTPYYLLNLFSNIFKAGKRSTRYLALVFGFQRILWLYSAFKQATTFQVESDSCTNNKELQIAKVEQEQIRNMLTEIFKERADSFNEITDEYYSLFTSNNLRREIFRRIDAEKDVSPNKDKFKQVFPLFVELMKFVSKEFSDYQFIYIMKKSDENKYLTVKFSTNSPEVEYLFTEQELPPFRVYLNKKGTHEFITMSPFIYYRQCKYHLEKELFVFSNIQYNDLTGKKRLHYVGEHFMCSPTTPPKEQLKDE